MTNNAHYGGRWSDSMSTAGISGTEHIAQQDLLAQVQAAHREWQAAQNYFQEVSAPELVDVAIYSLEAAQRKYMYLVRQLRQTRSSAPNPEG